MFTDAIGLYFLLQKFFFSCIVHSFNAKDEENERNVVCLSCVKEIEMSFHLQDSFLHT